MAIDGVSYGQSNPLSLRASPVTLTAHWAALPLATMFTLTVTASNASGTTSVSHTFVTYSSALGCPETSDTTISLDGFSVPSQVCYGNGVPYESYGNSAWGDCELAAAASLEQTWDGEIGDSIAPLDESTIIAEYEQLSGATPDDPSVGLGNSQLFAQWSGAGIVGTTISPQVSTLQTTNTGMIESAIWQFGGVYASVDLPNVDRSLADNTEWNLANSQGATSGHAIALVGYNQTDLFIVTWGRIQAVSWQWWDQYATGAYAVLPTQFVIAGHGPVSSVAALQSDLSA